MTIGRRKVGAPFDFGLGGGQGGLWVVGQNVHGDLGLHVLGEIVDDALQQGQFGDGVGVADQLVHRFDVLRDESQLLGQMVRFVPRDT